MRYVDIRIAEIDDGRKMKLQNRVQRGKKAPDFSREDEFPFCNKKNKKRILSRCSAKTQYQNYPYNNMKYELFG